MAVLTLAACGTQSAHPVGAGGGSGSPSAQSSASRTSGIPRALSGVDPARLPNADAGVARLLKAMPPAVAGHPRTKVTRSEVHYADGSRFTVEPLTWGGGPEMTMSDFFTRFKNSGQFTVRAQNSPGEALLWFSAEGQPHTTMRFLPWLPEMGNGSSESTPSTRPRSMHSFGLSRPPQPDPAETRPRPRP